MLRISKILLRGIGLKDALVTFESGANILAGESQTGKSYLIHCLDYIFGSKKLEKRLKEAAGYSHLFVEFENEAGQLLTLERSLSGGGLTAYRTAIHNITGTGEKIAAKRSGKSDKPDITSVLFPLAGINEAQLRKNARGSTQRLTIRTLAPLCLIDEVAVIDEHSPVIGKPSFDVTARKRTLAYMLSGKDDKGIIEGEKKDLANARLKAKIDLIVDLLNPIEQRLKQNKLPSNGSLEEIEASINDLSQKMRIVANDVDVLRQEQRDMTTKSLRAESQILAIDELLSRYHLLDERYRSDLGRLDFLAEGAFYFDGLQAVHCPLCDQPMSAEHLHDTQVTEVSVHNATLTEAAKIHAQRKDLSEAIAALNARRSINENDKEQCESALGLIRDRLSNALTPKLNETVAELERLVELRSEFEAERRDREERTRLIDMKSELEGVPNEGEAANGEWENLPSFALTEFCKEIEAVLKEWQWKGSGRVEFDEKAFDIIVDGEARISYGKGVRAILYSAFAIGLLRYCQINKKPHLGFVIIDSPLTSYKKGQTRSRNENPVDAGIEAAFWESLKKVSKEIQIIIIENKEPPSHVTDVVPYEWFAGESAQKGDRVAFIPQP